MKRTSKIAAGAVVGLLLLSTGHASIAQEKPKKPILPEQITWKLQALDQAPFKVVSTQADAKTGQFYWVLELIRDLDVYEDSGYWAPAYKLGKRTRFRFEFHDSDGIVIARVEGQYIGEYVTKAGKRFGTLLQVPPELMKATKTVEALGK